MITTVTLNAAIDKTYYLPSFSLSQVTRVRRMFAEPGGKGLNVARVIRQLGYPVTATGIVGGNNGRFIENALSVQEIAHDFIRIEDESRLCLNFIDESSGASTEVLEQGPVVPEYAWMSFKTKLAQLAGRSRVVCFSGSLPQGIPYDGYAQLVRIVKQAGALAFLDTSGEALIQGSAAHPNFIKPNEYEIATLLESMGSPTAGLKLGDALKCLQSAAGIPNITVSLGAEGSITCFEQTLFRVNAPKLQAVNTVGCGDSFVAGMAAATLEGLPIEQCLQWATAAAAANALTDRAGYVNMQDVNFLKEQINVEQL
jgi:tagatose 6-phosphate kinase